MIRIFKTQINQPLQGFSLLKTVFFVGMGGIAEYSENVKLGLSAQVLGCGQVLLPLPGGYMPENGKNNQHYEMPMQLCCANQPPHQTQTANSCCESQIP
jgi:hypothetical protein